MRLLSAKQRQRIKQLIRDHHQVLIVELCGSDAIPAADYLRLQEAGKIKKLPEYPMDIVTAAHVLGGLIADSPLSKIAPDSFWEIARHTDILSTQEAEAVQLAKENVGHYIKGIGDKYEQALHLAVSSTDQKMRKKQLLAVQQTVAMGIEQQQSIAEIAAALAKATKDSQRDWMRVAHTEVHNCIEEGKALALVSAHGGDPLVYKLPQPGACPYCKVLYLKPNGAPRVFKLSDLMANGTNVGLKAGTPEKTNLKPVIGAVHPFCRCQLHYLPDNSKFNSKGQLVTTLHKSEVTVETLNTALADHTCP